MEGMAPTPAPRRAGSVYSGSRSSHGWLLTLIVAAAALLTAFMGLRSAVESIAAEPAVRVRVVEPLGGPVGSRALAKSVAPPESAAPLSLDNQPSPSIAESGSPDATTITTVPPIESAPSREAVVSAAGLDSGSSAIAPVATLATAATIPGELRIWAGGDSLSQFMGEAIYRRATGVAASPATFVGSGLMNSAIVDWPSFAADEMRSHTPDVAVFVMGTNDAKPGVEAAEYARRAGAMMDILGDNGGRRVVWVGAPMMSAAHASLNAEIPAINAAITSEAAARPRVTYISAWDLLAENGGYAEWLPGPGGSLVRVRAQDGIHYTVAGGEIVATAVLAAIR